MPKIKANGINIYYEIHGQGEPLVMIGGAGTDTSIWLAVLAELARHFQVILFDSRGAGKTDMPEGTYSTELMAQDTYQFMQRLNLKSAHIVGHSLGGAVAQQLALQNPEAVRRLILCGTFGKLNLISRYVIKSSVDMHRAGVPSTLLYNNHIPWLYSQTFLADRQKIQVLFDKAGKTKTRPELEGLARQGDACLNHDTLDKLNQIPHQTLVVSADCDLMIPLESAEEMVAKLPNARLAIIEKTAHLFIIEKPHEFSNLVINFLKEA